MIQSLPGSYSNLRKINWSSDEKSIVTWSIDNTIVVWDIDTGKPGKKFYPLQCPIIDAKLNNTKNNFTDEDILALKQNGATLS